MSALTYHHQETGPRHDGTLGETDPAALCRRQRQINYGKNNPAYAHYVNTIPKDHRFEGCPRTPDPYRKATRRSFDREVKQWKIDVHICSDALALIEATKQKELKQGIQPWN